MKDLISDGFLFYAYWNGEQVRDLFEGLVAVTTGGGFAQLAAFLVVTGLVAVLLTGAVKGEGRHVISYFACAVLIWFVAIVPKATVAIQDVRSHTVYTVDNVPLSMAFFASAASRIGHWMTQTYETAFIPADVAKYSSFGAVYPERVLEVLQRTGPVTVQGREALQAVLKHCVLPEAVLDPAKASQLLSASDLWVVVKTEGWVNPARLAVMPDGKTLRCPAAVTELEGILNTVELPQLMRWVAMKLDADSVNPTTSIASSITQTESLLLGISRSAESSLKHSLMLTTLPSVMSGHAVDVSGPSAMASALARSQGNLAGEINYRTMAKIAEDALPKIRNALEFVVIAMFPVVALISLVSGSGMGQVVRSYLLLLLTIQLWPALSSVVNYLVITRDMHPFTLLAQNFGAASIQASVIIRETGASSQAIAGALLCAVPVISYALVRAGDMAVGQLVGGLMQPAQGAATSQGASIAAGNISQGNVSVGNVSSNNVASNKADASVRTVDAGTVVTQSGYGSVTRAASGEVTGLQRTAVSFGVGAQTSQSFVRGHAADHTQTNTVSTTDAARFSFQQSASSRDSAERGFSHALKEALSNQISLGTNYADSSGWGSSVTLTRGTELTRASSVSEGTDYSSSFTAGVNREKYFDAPKADKGAPVRSTAVSTLLVPTAVPRDGANVSGAETDQIAGIFTRLLDDFNPENMTRHAGLSGRLQGNVSFNDAQNLLDSATGKTGTVNSDRQEQSYNLVRSAAENVARNHVDDRVRSVAQNFVRSLDRVHSTGRELSQTSSESVSAGSSLNQGESGTFATTVDSAVPLMHQAVEQFGSGEAVLRASYRQGEVAAFAGDQHVRTVMSAAPSDRFGPGTFVSANLRNGAVFEAAGTRVDQADAENRARLEEASTATREEVADSALTTVSSAGSSDLQMDFQQFVAAHQGDAQARARRMNFDRGVMLVAREAYSKENQDKNFALRNAFLAGWGYRSGDEIQEDLRSWAADSPALRDRLERIGAADSDRVSEDDWKVMTEIARQPRGIRLP